MDMLGRLSIDMFPAVVLVMIYFNNQKKVTRVAEKWLLGILALLAVALMAADLAVCGLFGTVHPVPLTVLWGVCILRELLMAGIAADWLAFVCSRLFTGERKRRGQRMTGISAVIAVIFAGLLVTTPWSGLLFRLTEQRGYVRGPVWWLVWVVCTVFLAEGGAEAVRLYRRETVREQRVEERQIFWMSLGIFAGISVEFWFLNWWFAGPAVSLVLLSLYMNRQNRQITTDGLTGLNNRRRFDQELHRRAELAGGQSWGMLMVDIDDFKWINDNLGHVVGDEALKETAGILQRTFARERAFLARYGGDEFVVVEAFKDVSEAEAVIARIEDERVRFNEAGGRDYRISLSIGYALWSEVPHNSTERLVDLADERMYQVKEKHKAAAKKP